MQILVNYSEPKVSSAQSLELLVCFLAIVSYRKYQKGQMPRHGKGLRESRNASNATSETTGIQENIEKGAKHDKRKCPTNGIKASSSLMLKCPAFTTNLLTKLCIAL